MKTALITFGAITYGLLGILLILHYAPSSPEKAGYFDGEELVDFFVDAGFQSGETETESSLLKVRTIVITTDINAQVSKQVMRQLLLLNALDPEQPINLFLRTQGGWNADTYSIIDTMNGLDAPVHVHAVGDVNSAGCMILAAGTGNRIVYPSTIVGFHAWTEGAVDYNEPDALLFRSRYLNILRQHTNLPKEWTDAVDGEMFYMNPRQAVEYGVADFVAKPRHAPNAE